MGAEAPRGVRHVYHLSGPRLLLLPLVWAAVVGPLVVLAATAANADEARSFGVSALLVTLLLLPGLALVWQSRLVLTAEGIAHHQFGYTIASRWDNVTSLVLAPGAQSLLLDEPGTRSRLLRGSARLMKTVVPSIADGVLGDADRLAEGRLILLAPFIAHWKRGTLRDDLMRWAPHLFDANGEPRERAGA